MSAALNVSNSQLYSLCALACFFSLSLCFFFLSNFLAWGGARCYFWKDARALPYPCSAQALEK